MEKRVALRMFPVSNISAPSILPLYFLSSIIPIQTRYLLLGYARVRIIEELDLEKEWSLQINNVVYQDNCFYLRFELPGLITLMNFVLKKYKVKIEISGQMATGTSSLPHRDTVLATNRWLKSNPVYYTFNPLIHLSEVAVQNENRIFG